MRCTNGMRLICTEVENQHDLAHRILRRSLWPTSAMPGEGVGCVTRLLTRVSRGAREQEEVGVMGCIHAKIALVAYEEQAWIFVLVPNQHGRYVRTEKCVAWSVCPHCKATVGEPCFKTIKGERIYGGTIHYRRKKQRKPENYKRFKPKRDNEPLCEEEDYAS